VPNLSELQAILAAAIKLVQPKFELFGSRPGAVRKYVAYLHKVLPSTQIGLSQAPPRPARWNGQAGLGGPGWLRPTRAANRAGRPGLWRPGRGRARDRSGGAGASHAARANHPSLARWGVCSTTSICAARPGLAMVVARTLDAAGGAFLLRARACSTRAWSAGSWRPFASRTVMVVDPQIEAGTRGWWLSSSKTRDSRSRSARRARPCRRSGLKTAR